MLQDIGFKEKRIAIESALNDARTKHEKYVHSDYKQASEAACMVLDSYFAQTPTAKSPRIETQKAIYRLKALCWEKLSDDLDKEGLDEKVKDLELKNEPSTPEEFKQDILYRIAADKLLPELPKDMEWDGEYASFYIILAAINAGSNWRDATSKLYDVVKNLAKSKGKPEWIDEYGLLNKDWKTEEQNEFMVRELGNDLLSYRALTIYFNVFLRGKSALDILRKAVDGYEYEHWFTYAYASQSAAPQLPFDKVNTELTEDAKKRLFAIEGKTRPSGEAVENNAARMHENWGDFRFNIATTIEELDKAKNHYHDAERETSIEEKGNVNVEIGKIDECIRSVSAIEEKLKEWDLTPIPRKKKGFLRTVKESIFGSPDEVNETDSDWGKIKDNYDHLREYWRENHPYMRKLRAKMRQWGNAHGESSRQKMERNLINQRKLAEVVLSLLEGPAPAGKRERKLNNETLSSLKKPEALLAEMFAYNKRRIQPIIESIKEVISRDRFEEKGE